MNSSEFDRQREAMVETQLRRQGIVDELVLKALSMVPREEFVPPELQSRAYEDRPLEIGHGQTISQPFTVAFMVQALKLQGLEHVLEIGTGCGYAAAVLSLIAGTVHTIERIPELAAAATGRLQQLGYGNVDVHIGDGSLGWPEAAPYDAIVAAASSPFIPQPLMAQLAQGGRLVMPIGEGRRQRLVRAVRQGEEFGIEDLGRFVFVPLIGEHGWKARPEADPD